MERLPTLPPVLGALSYPAATDRAFWDGLPPATRAELIGRGEAFLGFAWPPLPATDYLAFVRTGDRTAYEDRYFPRRCALCALVLAECAEHRGRFLDDVLNGLWALCEESAWQLPAHNNYVRDAPTLPLPDVERPIPDLFACETGATLSLCVHLLEAELAAAFPHLAGRVRTQVEQRILTPYLTSHFWWMGDGDEPMCNWTSWCTQNVLLCAFLTGQSQAVRRQVVERACSSLDCFLKDYGEDGCCPEGAMYYRHAGLTLWGAMEVLNQVSQGHFAPLFRRPKIRNIAAYLSTVHVSGDWYLNYADCGPKPGPCGVREFLFGRRTENPALMDLAAADWVGLPCHDQPEEISLFYRLLGVLHGGELASYTPSGVQPPDVYCPSTGLWVARDETWCVSVRAGSNGGSHGHNDAGSLIVYHAGRPLFIDIGVETYSKKTFSSDRYSIWTMRSDWHNLPTIQGSVQENGPQYTATEVASHLDGAECRISMDLAGAYPLPADSCSYRRTVHLVKGGSLTVEDCYTGPGQAVLSLLFCEEPSWDGSTLAVGDAGRLLLTGGTPEFEAVPITDPRLRQGWPDLLYRAQIPFHGALRLTFL